MHPVTGNRQKLSVNDPRPHHHHWHVSQERIFERIVEQIVAGGDFPSRAGPRFVLPELGSTAAGAEQIADIPSSGGPHSFLPGQVSTAFPRAEHGHDAHGHGALHGSRRGGGAVVGPQGSVPGQSSTARRVDAHVPDSSEWV